MRPCPKSGPLRPLLAACALLLLLIFSGCVRHAAPLPPPPPEKETPTEDAAVPVWQRFVTRAKAAEGLSGPFRISATLRYKDQEEKNTRVSALLWGNNKADSPWPLRLDLSAGVGTVVAKVREDSRSFTAFVPSKNVAYAHEGDSRTLASFGVPVPLSLSDLALLLTGRPGALFLSAQSSGDSGAPAERKSTPQGASFILPPGTRLAGELELSESGAPIGWKETQRGGWSMVIEPGEPDPLKPAKLRISHGKGLSALIVVKSIERVSPPYSGEQMGLVLPPDAAREALPR